MQISNKLVGIIHYTLRDDDGQVIDSSAGEAPLEYLHGAQNLVPGLEAELEGKKVGDKFNTAIDPEQGYGEVDPKLIQELPIASFGGVEKVEVGMEFHAEIEDGMQTVEIIAIEDDSVTINGNHPLAGVVLNFEVEVVGIREASSDELEHGHIHSAEGCGH